jgi:hypothetical protein
VQSWLLRLAIFFRGPRGDPYFEGSAIVQSPVNEVPELISFGLLWKVFDFILKMTEGGNEKERKKAGTIS